MSEISATQTRLSEELQLLDELSHSYPSPPKKPTPNTPADFPLLDIIAVCLTTGKAGDIVAAAFDKREQFTLVLAKTGVVDPADYALTESFLSKLRTAESWFDLLPFLATHGKDNMNKRIKSLHECITEFSEDLALAAKTYCFSSVIEREFPKSKVYRKILYPNEQLTVESFLSHLIRRCVEGSTFEMGVEQTSVARYVQLHAAADVLRQSRLLCILTGELRVRDANLKYIDNNIMAHAWRLKKCLDKICQYGDLKNLIKLVKRFPDVPFHWVEDAFDGSGEGTFEICADPMEVVERKLKRKSSPGLVAAITAKHPRLARNWEQRRLVSTRIHPELRIVLHLSRPLRSASPAVLPSAVLPPADTYWPIGCSKKSCMCCSIWIDAFNSKTQMSWLTIAGSSKSYINWALPGPAGEMGEVWRHRSFDDVVVDYVNTDLRDELLPFHLIERAAAGDFENESPLQRDFRLAFCSAGLP